MTGNISQEQIARDFSKGEFERTFQYLADDVQWTVAGEMTLKGREEVVSHCLKTAVYFASVTTDFRIISVISSNGRVAVEGTAEFIKDGKKTAFVHACDVYEFREGRLMNIRSYCVRENF